MSDIHYEGHIHSGCEERPIREWKPGDGYPLPPMEDSAYPSDAQPLPAIESAAMGRPLPTAGGETGVASSMPATGASAATVEFEERHAHHMHILGLIRDDHGWALSRILLAERLEEAVRHVIADSPGTPETVKGYLRTALRGF